MGAGFHFHFDADLTDERGHSWTASGSPAIQAGAAKFGAGGAYFNGSSGLYIQPSTGSDFRATGQFTLEGWARLDTAGDGHLVAMMQGGESNYHSAWSIWYTSAALILYSGYHGNIVTAANPPRNTLFHFAWTRDAAGDMRLFINGALQQSAVFNDWVIDPNILTIGTYVSAIGNNYANLTGALDELIFDIGVCRYTANFTPPTGPFTGPAEARIASPGPLGTPALLGHHQFAGLSAAGPLGAAALVASQYYASLAVDGPLGAPALLGFQQSAIVAAASPLGTPALLAAQQFASLAAPGPLGTPQLLGTVPIVGVIGTPGPLAAPQLLAWHDFTTGLTGAEAIRYVMDLVTPGGLVRVPISSWQATLQTDSACYVQCVVPAAAPWASAILAATDFVISRQATTAGGQVIEYEMARSALEVREPSQGPNNYTIVLSGYPDALTPNDNPPAAQDRALTGVRSVAGLPGSVRMRANIDWLLRPGMRATYASQDILVDYINYYVPGNDQYMDVGERS